MNTAPAPIYINRNLHEKLKLKALRDRKRLYQLCEEHLSLLVKRQPKNGRAPK